MFKQSINGVEVFIIYDNIKKKYVVINDFGIFYLDEKPTTDQEIEKMELLLEQVKIETCYLKNT